MTKTFRLAMALSLAAIASALADDWPQFRGPTGDGIATAKKAPLSWSLTNNIVWTAEIPGRGRSSPVVVGDRIWLTTALETNPRKTRVESDPVTVVDRAELLLVCLERASGKELYRASLFRVEKPPPAHELNSFATPTPVVEAGRVYCDFGTFGTACVEGATGQILWTNRLAIDHQLAAASSPVVWKNLLILTRDGRDRQFMAALDKASGKVVWETNRPPILIGSGNQKKSFSTPLIAELAGRTQLVTACGHWFVSYDPGTGRELWRMKHGTGFSIGPRPVAGNGLVYVMTGMTHQLWAIQPDGNGDVTGKHLAWKTSSGIGTLVSPLLVGKEIYALNDQGLITCFDAATGQELGTRGTGGAGGASPFYANGRIYVFNQKGKATVLKAGKEMEVLAQNELEGPLFASPAVLDDGLYVRTDSHLYCIGGN